MSVLVEAQRVAIARAIAANQTSVSKPVRVHLNPPEEPLCMISRYRDIMGETVSGLGGCSCQCWHGFTA